MRAIVNTVPVGTRAHLTYDLGEARSEDR